jgi:hypothetical protein
MPRKCTTDASTWSACNNERQKRLTFDADLKFCPGKVRLRQEQHARELASAEKLLFLFAARLLSSLRALARTFRGSYVVGVVVVFLHRDFRK